MLFILLLILIIRGDDICDKRTKIYQDVGNNNSNYFYFDPNTYMESIVPMNNDIYKKYIRDRIKCIGKWCIDNEWKCNFGNSRPCYNAEHIVARSNSIKEIEHCSVDIQGNLIMAYGAWNQDMKNSYYGEKNIVYGEEIFKSAYRSIYLACYGSEPKYYHMELCLSEKYKQYKQYQFLYLIFTIFSLSLMVMAGIYIYDKHLR